MYTKSIAIKRLIKRLLLHVDSVGVMMDSDGTEEHTLTINGRLMRDGMLESELFFYVSGYIDARTNK